MRIDIDKLKSEIRSLATMLRGEPQRWPFKNKLRYTRLCALRASLRGRLHFAPGTRPDAVHFYKLPCMDRSEPSGNWKYTKVTLEAQAEWVEPLLAEFALETVLEPTV